MSRFPIVSDNPKIQAFYERLRENGVSHRLAEVLAFRQPPMTKTDREFFQGMGTLADQFAGDEIGLQFIISEAQKHGYTPNPNDVYLPALAAFPGDPEAFVPPDDARGHIRRVCEKRGWSCEGIVEVKGRTPDDEPPGVPLAEDIVEREVNRLIQQDPNLATKREELKEKVISEHGSEE